MEPRAKKLLRDLKRCFSLRGVHSAYRPGWITFEALAGCNPAGASAFRGPKCRRDSYTIAVG